MPESCAMEMCPNWSGDGRVCPCAVFDQPAIFRDGRRDLVEHVYDEEEADA